VVNFATCKNFVVKRTMFLIATFLNVPGSVLREGHNQIDHTLIDRRHHSSILNVDVSEGRIVIAKVRERLALSKQAVQKIDMERFNMKKLNEGS
jgi:hypothetical protein